MSDALNTILQGLLVNPVIEEYDEAGWHVVKYANGRAEAVLMEEAVIHSGDSQFPMNGWYYGVHITDIPAAIIGEFTQIQNVTGELVNKIPNANYLITVNSYEMTEQKHYFRVAITTANDYWTYYKKITITGKWK